VRIEDVN